ncbi:uncharacterized protein LOC124178399 [Neodiprion fabricii]|uniref:uncharacterized protein LOC124178399 n=1 Tax=Neodiprion fabricii TaxID=2872261 RepID=UPI001ED900AE|nr:uncharacterized protein LOC124178399 [Neodiprion fabricii]
MDLILLFVLSYAGVHGLEDQVNSNEPAAFNEEHFYALQHRHVEEWKCLQKVANFLTSRWNNGLKKVSDDVLDNVPLVKRRDERYSTDEEEWLLEAGSTSNTIQSCVLEMMQSGIMTTMNEEDGKCFKVILRNYVMEEEAQEKTFKRFLESSLEEQPPFRRFVSFVEMVDLLFQSKKPDALDDIEKKVFDQSKKYLRKDEDRLDRTYIMEQECEWKNAKALRETANDDARFVEFARQVRDSVNQMVGNIILRHWNSNSTLTQLRYMAWLDARKNMMMNIDEEIARIRFQNKDPQWLCMWATRFAYELSREQGSILVDRSSRDRASVKILAEEEHKDQKMCFEALTHVVEHNHRLTIALAVVDEIYNYPQLYCKNDQENLGRIAPIFCKCSGTICAPHSIPYVYSYNYTLVQEGNGTYKVTCDYSPKDHWLET